MTLQPWQIERGFKEFKNAAGTPHRIGLNYDKGAYHPGNGIFSPELGSMSVETARQIAKHLTELADEVMAAKPKEPTAVEQVRALPTGSIFTTIGYPNRYVKLENGTVQALDWAGVVNDIYAPESWDKASAINVLYNPGEAK